MPKLFVSKATVIAALAACAAGAQAASLRFDDAFAVRSSVSVHYEARFTAQDGREQKMESWRDGDTRVRRRTNDAIEVHAVRKPGEPEYAMTVLDLKRKLLTRIDRTNLFRIGNFTDWFDLAHALKHPRGDYSLAAAAAPQGAGQPMGACSWFDLEQQGRISHICWSAKAQLPLAIVNAQGRTVWRVTKLEPGRIAPETFRFDARQFIVNNANEDIERD